MHNNNVNNMINSVRNISNNNNNNNNILIKTPSHQSINSQQQQQLSSQQSQQLSVQQLPPHSPTLAPLNTHSHPLSTIPNFTTQFM